MKEGFMESPISFQRAGVVVAQSDFFRRVYNWMAAGLLLTGLVPLYAAESPSVLNLVFGNRLVFYALLIAEVGLVLVLSAAINRLSVMAATIMFLVYSALSGVTFSVIFLLYTRSS